MKLIDRIKTHINDGNLEEIKKTIENVPLLIRTIAPAFGNTLIKDFEFKGNIIDYLLISVSSIGVYLKIVIFKSPDVKIFNFDDSFTNDYKKLENELLNIKNELDLDPQFLKEKISPLIGEKPYFINFSFHVVFSRRTEFRNESRKQKWILRANLLKGSHIHIMTYCRILQILDELYANKDDMLKKMRFLNCIEYNEIIRFNENLGKLDVSNLRTKRWSKENYNDIRNDIRNNNLRLALNKIDEFIDTEQLFKDEILLIKSRLNGLNRNIIFGVISKEEEIINMNRIKYSIVKLIELCYVQSRRVT